MEDAPDAASTGGLLTIDLAALRENYRRLAERVSPARCGGVVKADAYGLGAAWVAPVLYRAGCRDFFVAHLAEGLTLRPRLPDDAAIVVLNGLQPGGEIRCAEAGLVPVLNSLEQVEAWATTCTRVGRKLPAALQVDTGMSRLGLPPAELERLLGRAGLLQAIDLRFVMSHLACADEPDHPANPAQLGVLAGVLDRLPETLVSFANSGGVLLDARFHYDLARPGIAVYGVNPTPRGADPFRPVVRLDARVIQVRTVPAGTGIGYGRVFTAPHPMRIATIAVGYADGWPRQLGDRGVAFAEDVPLPIVGRVSMDSMTLDVTALPDGALRLGSLVELIGPHQTLDAVAVRAGTIAYEILTGLGRRFARRYLGDDDRVRPASTRAA